MKHFGSSLFILTIVVPCPGKSDHSKSKLRMNCECRLSYFPGGLAPSCSFWETALAVSQAQ